MAETSLPRLTRILGELLAASVQAPLPAYTKRRIFGPTGLTGKATAIVGMRRAGKTTFLHQLRRRRRTSRAGVIRDCASPAGGYLDGRANRPNSE